ncbi:Phosphocarrier protein HPr [Sporomusa rhizae]|uniref:HPr family phosphocarrier protein n=1 Tax=Sporomusa rhizae TaxID=357999 RepID=UPI00352A031B
MIKVDVTLTNASGLHARPAAQLVQAVNQYKCSIVRVAKDGREVDAKSMIGIMSLGAKQGSVLTISVDGPEEVEIVQLLTGLIESGFGEGE